MPPFVDQLAELRDAVGETRVAMATLLRARGGSPRPIGAKLFVDSQGRLLGSVSIGGCVDSRVAEHGQRALEEDAAKCVTVVVDDAEALELGLSCGAEFDMLVEPLSLAGGAAIEVYEEAERHGRSGGTGFVVTRFAGAVAQREFHAGEFTARGDELLVERIAPAGALVIVGTSDVAAALSRIARMVGFRVVVVDGRERNMSRSRFADADDVLVGMPSELVQQHLHAGGYVVLTSHDYRYELPVLREALRSDVRFIGMLAGRKRADAVRQLLRDEGFDDEALSRLNAPVGLDIGGREPEEIAVSIVAQLVAVRENKPIARR